MNKKYEDPHDVQARNYREEREREYYRESKSGEPVQRKKQQANLKEQKKAKSKEVQKYGKNGAPTIMIDAKSVQPSLVKTVGTFIDKYDNEALAVVDGVKGYTDYIGAAGKGAELYATGTFGWAKSGKIKYYPPKNGVAWGGNQSTQVAKASKMGAFLDNKAGKIGNLADGLTVWVAVSEDGYKYGEKTEEAVVKIAGGKLGAKVLTTATAPVCGTMTSSGLLTVVGIACHAGSDRLGDWAGGEIAVDLLKHDRMWKKMTPTERSAYIIKMAEPELEKFNKEMDEYKKSQENQNGPKIGE